MQQYFSNRLMRMDGNGLLDYWLKQVSADPTYCFNKIQQQIINQKGNRKDKKSLTLNSLSGAFLVLGVGYALAIGAFIVEIVNGLCEKKRSKIQAIKKSIISQQEQSVTHVVRLTTAVAHVIQDHHHTIRPNNAMNKDIDNGPTAVVVQEVPDQTVAGTPRHQQHVEVTTEVYPLNAPLTL